MHTRARPDLISMHHRRSTLAREKVNPRERLYTSLLFRDVARGENYRYSGHVRWQSSSLLRLFPAEARSLQHSSLQQRFTSGGSCSTDVCASSPLRRKFFSFVFRPPVSRSCVNYIHDAVGICRSFCPSRLVFGTNGGVRCLLKCFQSRRSRLGNLDRRW